MAKIISFVSPKGGSGKSTHTWLFAKEMSTESKVLIIDADPQGSLIDLYKIHLGNGYEPTESFNVIPALINNVPNLLKQNFDKYDAIFIDFQGVLHDNSGDEIPILKTLLLVDHIIIPVRPSHFDQLALIKAKENIDKVMTVREANKAKTTAIAFVNECRNAKMECDTKEILRANGFVVTRNSIGQSVWYPRRTTQISSKSKFPKQIEYGNFYSEINTIIS